LRFGYKATASCAVKKVTTLFQAKTDSFLHFTDLNCAFSVTVIESLSFFCIQFVGFIYFILNEHVSHFICLSNYSSKINNKIAWSSIFNTKCAEVWRCYIQMSKVHNLLLLKGQHKFLTAYVSHPKDFFFSKK